MVTISGMYSVARGSASGACRPSSAQSSCMAVMKRLASAFQSSPFSCARWMILSSMSVMLRT